MPDKEKDSDKKIRKMASDIVNELIKSGEVMRIDVKAGDIAAECKPRFANCDDYTCEKKFKCTGETFDCWGKFKDSPDYTLTLG